MRSLSRGREMLPFTSSKPVNSAWMTHTIQIVSTGASVKLTGRVDTIIEYLWHDKKRTCTQLCHLLAIEANNISDSSSLSSHA